MIKVYAKKDVEKKIIEHLAEFRCRVFLSYPVKGVTRKKTGKPTYKVVNAPL